MGAAKIIISKELVVSILSSGNEYPAFFCDSGLPVGCVFMGAGTDQFGNLLLRFEGPGLPGCDAGEKPQEIIPTYSVKST